MAYLDKGGVTVNGVGFKGSEGKGDLETAGGLEGWDLASISLEAAVTADDAFGGGGVEADEEGVEAEGIKNEGGTAVKAPREWGGKPGGPVLKGGRGGGTGGCWPADKAAAVAAWR